MTDSTKQDIKSVPEEIKKLLQQVISNKQTIMSIALARIFIARSESDWVYSNLLGIICMIWDREKNNTPFLRLFDIETFDLLFEVEMYIDFNEKYICLTPYFYIFEYMSAFIGIQFSKEVEAKNFYAKVISQSLKSSNLNVQEQVQAKAQTNQKKKKEKEGLFGFRQRAKKLFKTYFKKNSTDEKNDQCEQQYEISRPISVQRMSSIQFDYTTNQFDFSNLNDEWKQLFLRAGIQNADLSNEQIAPIIFESVIRFQSQYEQQIEQIQNQEDSLNKKDSKQSQQQTPNIKQQISINSNQNDIIPDSSSSKNNLSSQQNNSQSLQKNSVLQNVNLNSYYQYQQSFQ